MHNGINDLWNQTRQGGVEEPACDTHTYIHTWEWHFLARYKNCHTISYLIERRTTSCHRRFWQVPPTVWSPIRRVFVRPPKLRRPKLLCTVHGWESSANEPFANWEHLGWVPSLLKIYWRLSGNPAPGVNSRLACWRHTVQLPFYVFLFCFCN